MVVQVNEIWVLGATATIPIATLWAAVNATSIVPLGAADTREQGRKAEALSKTALLRQSNIQKQYDYRITHAES